MEFVALLVVLTVIAVAIYFYTKSEAKKESEVVYPEPADQDSSDAVDFENPPLNGWKPEHVDLRDKIYEEVESEAVTRTVLPPMVDLRGRFRTAVESQGSTNSCVGHAVTGMVEAIFRSVADRSRLFTYWNARSFEGTTNADPGCQIRNAMRGVSMFGIANESVWPFSTDQTTLRTKPSAAAYKDGLPLRSSIGSYARITTFDGMKSALAAGRAVVFGFSATRAFVYDTRTTGHLPYPATGEAFLGGHAVVAVGYDDATKKVLCRNSYGSAWGMGGHFTMDYQWFANMNGLVADAWTIIPR